MILEWMQILGLPMRQQVGLTKTRNVKERATSVVFVRAVLRDLTLLGGEETPRVGLSDLPRLLQPGGNSLHGVETDCLRSQWEKVVPEYFLLALGLQPKVNLRKKRLILDIMQIE